MEKLLRRTIGEHIALRTEFASDLPPILADPGQMEQVILNLSVNARDAMPGGGLLLFRTERVVEDRPRAGVGQYLEHLTSGEARRIAHGIARLPEFMMLRKDFHQRGNGQYRWKKSRPYHVALEDSYIRAHWGWIDAVCRPNSLPFDPTGQRIDRDGSWCVYEFAMQLDAIQFWDRFNGRWLRGEEFIYPDRPKGLPTLREPPDMYRHGRRPY